MTDTLWDLLEMKGKAELAPSVDGHGLVRFNAKAINLTERVHGIERAFSVLYNPPSGPWHYWVKTVFDEYIIVEHETAKGTLWYQVAFSEDADGKVSFAPSAEWVEGEFVFQPGSGQRRWLGRQPIGVAQ